MDGPLGCTCTCIVFLKQERSHKSTLAFIEYACIHVYVCTDGDFLIGKYYISVKLIIVLFLQFFIHLSLSLLVKDGRSSWSSTGREAEMGKKTDFIIFSY